MLITELGLMQRFFHTVPLTLEQWEICLVPGVVLLTLGEIVKIILRARRARRGRAVAGLWPRRRLRAPARRRGDQPASTRARKALTAGTTMSAG